jgi:hypothetical protein
MGVLVEVVMVKVLGNVGVPICGLNEQSAPSGSPLTQLRLTDGAVPTNKIAKIVLLPEPVWRATTLPELDSEKSKLETVRVN